MEQDNKCCYLSNYKGQLLGRITQLTLIIVKKKWPRHIRDEKTIRNELVC